MSPAAEIDACPLTCLNRLAPTCVIHRPSAENDAGAAEVLARWQYETYDSHFTMPGGLTWEEYKADDPDGAEGVYLSPARMMAAALAEAGLLTRVIPPGVASSAPATESGQA